MRSLWTVSSLWITLLAPAQTQPAAPAADATPTSTYGLASGPLQAMSRELTLKDSKRNIELPIRVRFPGHAEQPVPLVIFSHGMGGSFDAFAALTEHWTTHGYVVILPTHEDSISRQKEGSGRDFARDPQGYRKRVDPQGRVDDVRLILDSLDEIEKQIPELGLKDGRKVIDRERLGIAGHSAGALTTTMAFGAKVRTRENIRPHSVGDDRFDAAIVISGQGTTNRMFTEDSWKEIAKPMLVITGSQDTSVAGNETPASRRQPYDLASPGDKYMLFIEGATHSSYSGKDTQGRRAMALGREKPGTDITIIGDAVASQTLAFWDAFLKDNAEAKAYLVADSVRALDPAVKPEHK